MFCSPQICTEKKVLKATNKIIITVLFVSGTAGMHDCVTNYMWSRHLIEEMLSRIGCCRCDKFHRLRCHHLYLIASLHAIRFSKSKDQEQHFRPLSVWQRSSYAFDSYCQQSIKYFKLIIFRGSRGQNRCSYNATNIAL